MRVIMCGSRGWRDRETIRDRLEQLPVDVIIVVGYDPHLRRPKGADEIVYEEARKLGLAVVTFPAKWNEHGGRAGHIRNSEMASSGADLCIAFWDGESSGTEGMIETARRRGIPVEVITL